MLFRKMTSLPIKTGKHAAGIIDFDGIHKRQNLEQIMFKPAAFAQFIKRMRNADERALILQTMNCLLWREPRRNLLRHERGEDLSLGGHDLLPHNDKLRVQSLSCPGARDRVVVGDDEAV